MDGQPSALLTIDEQLGQAAERVVALSFLADHLVPPPDEVSYRAHGRQQRLLRRHQLVDSGLNGRRGQSFVRKAAVLAIAVYIVHYEQ